MVTRVGEGSGVKQIGFKPGTKVDVDQMMAMMLGLTPQERNAAVKLSAETMRELAANRPPVLAILDKDRLPGGAPGVTVRIDGNTDNAGWVPT